LTDSVTVSALSVYGWSRLIWSI